MVVLLPTGSTLTVRGRRGDLRGITPALRAEMQKEDKKMVVLLPNYGRGGEQIPTDVEILSEVRGRFSLKREGEEMCRGSPRL